MSIDVLVHNSVPNQRLNDFVVRKVQTALRRFTGRVAGVEVQLQDHNGSKGGVDKACSIDAALIPRGKIHVTASDADIYTAVSKSVQRIRDAVTRSVDTGNQGKAIRRQQARNGDRRHAAAPEDV